MLQQSPMGERLIGDWGLHWILGAELGVCKGHKWPQGGVYTIKKLLMQRKGNPFLRSSVYTTKTLNWAKCSLKDQIAKGESES